MSKNYVKKVERTQVGPPVFFDDEKQIELQRAYDEVGTKGVVWKRPPVIGPWSVWGVVGSDDVTH